jgi:hypothetical protein
VYFLGTEMPWSWVAVLPILTWGPVNQIAFFLAMYALIAPVQFACFHHIEPM